MADLPYGINAWIFLNEDEPPQTNYTNPTSCYQSLIQYQVYNSINFLGIAFFEVISTSNGCTLQVGNASHDGGLTNQDYLNFILRDARQVNPNILFLATAVYSGNNTLSQIFASEGDPYTQAKLFAENLVTYLKDNGMNGLDIDWEPPLSTQLTNAQFKILFSTIRQVFDQQPVKFYLSLTPAWPQDIVDEDTINSAFDFVSPQFYDGSSLIAFLSAGIAPEKIGYGAQFEPGNTAPNRDAQQVWENVSSGFSYGSNAYSYQDIFMWRLNSGNFQFEQGQFMILNTLANPSSSNTFDDSSIVGAAGNPQVTQMTVRSGEVLDAIQTVNTGNGSYNTGTANRSIGVFTLVQHGGDGGHASTIDIPLDDPIVTISGYTGIWYGWQCVLQLTLTSQSGVIYGPFGSMKGALSCSPFTQTAPSGQSIVAFKGATVRVPRANGAPTDIIAHLTAIYA